MSDEPGRRAGRGGRERILAAAITLFAERGITATTMEDIAAEAPVSKRTLYVHFPNKEDLVLAQLAHLLQAGPTLLKTLTRTDLPPRDRIMAMFSVVQGPDDETVRGCPFIRAAVEHPGPDDRVHVFAREQKLLMLALVIDLLKELDVDEPEPLAEQLVTLSDGVASRAMVLNDPDYGRFARAAAETLLDHAPRKTEVGTDDRPETGVAQAGK
ncbi:TetR/AcrR family transcriptional regulator [Actinoalloteichus hymeniacidonis]|uniref:Transcriptional regulator, TetR family n=1 Tax=Actinoalloteichus hymeniacidonis TaxID=340345 RepID=A0AAC9HMR6_9PSEU|nr:TetR/AcrR family transcriptional regulator [Actinoalloteichus hymeniacidonis]AOS61685.1 transcriptional regulator, TetR family [Actinoalloteichus hymeniacidonis]MBB5910300.1 AcrR family transcriptional regulator [Actinoalloteichus hymeniacidonis]